MKKSTILVGVNGAHIAFASGAKGIAILPAAKGEKESFVLTDQNKMVIMAGQRINGVGVTRYVTELGFMPAQPGDVAAERLMDCVDIRRGVKLVEESSRNEAIRLQALYGGKACTFVPFGEGKAAEAMLVRQPGHFSTTVFSFGTGFAAGSVEGEYKPEDGFSCTSAQLAEGWLVGPEEDPSAVPRNTEYGGLVEKAVFIMANCGLGSLVGPSLSMDDDAPDDASFPRGLMTLQLPESSDQLKVGINAVDELVVQYLRGGQVIYQRQGLECIGSSLNIGSAIGSIAAALVRVANIDQPKQGCQSKAA